MVLLVVSNLLRSVLRSPMTIGVVGKRSMASCKNGRSSKFVGGKYAPTTGVRWSADTISKLMTFGPWRLADSTVQFSWVLLLTRRAIPPWLLVVVYVQKISYPSVCRVWMSVANRVSVAMHMSIP